MVEITTFFPIVVKKCTNLKKINKVCCPLSVDLKKSAFRHFYKIINKAEQKS